MGGGSREEISIRRTLLILRLLCCPNARRAEGTPEWDQIKGSYTLSPDLVAGLLRGNGDPSDFFIDIVQPTGDQYFKELAGSPQAARLVASALNQKSDPFSFKLEDLGNTANNFLGPLNRKILKYSGSRLGTAMLGLAMYFAPSDGAYGGPVLAHLDSLRWLDSAFGLSHHLGAETPTILLEGILDSSAPFTSILSLPMSIPFSFLLWIADKSETFPKVVLIINDGITHKDYEFCEHSVIKWLRRLVETPTEITTAMLSDRFSNLFGLPPKWGSVETLRAREPFRPK